MRVSHTARLAASLALLAAPLTTLAQTRTPAPAPGASARSGNNPTVRREDWQRVPDIFAALGVKPGSRIADLGSGEGWLTTRLARQVGANGRVFAVDIDNNALTRLGETLAKDSLRNVEIILAEDDDPRLPFGTLDGVVIVNAYHEVTKRVPVLEGVRRALRPGGVLVIVDNIPADSSMRTRQEQVTRHSIALEFARDDLEAQGFEVVSTNPRFIDHKSGDHWQRQWMIVARRGDK